MWMHEVTGRCFSPNFYAHVKVVKSAGMRMLSSFLGDAGWFPEPQRQAGSMAGSFCLLHKGFILNLKGSLKILTQSPSGWALRAPEDECTDPDQALVTPSRICVCYRKKSSMILGLAMSFSLSLPPQLVILNHKPEPTCVHTSKGSSACPLCL